jgi:anti-sigma factor RsiW
MTCELWRDQIEMYVDGELASSHESEVASHLRGCSACTTFAADTIHLKRGITNAGHRYQPSSEFREKIMHSIGARKRSRRTMLWLQFAAASVVLVAIALGVWKWTGTRNDVTREIADVHLSTITSANPVDVISTDQHTVKPWFQGKLPFTFNLPDLAGSPFTLVGGRVVYVRGAPTALLLFQYKLHSISVLIGPVDVLGRGEESRATRDGFHVVQWAKSGRSYVVVGDASEDVISDVSLRMKRAAE